jgi:hypothetical protein
MNLRTNSCYFPIQQWLVFITETECVYCEVGPGLSYYSWRNETRLPFTSPSSEMPIAHFTFVCLLAQRAALYSVFHFNARRSPAVACLGRAMKQAPAARTNLACFNSAWLRSESSLMMKSGLKSTFRTIVVCPWLRWKSWLLLYLKYGGTTIDRNVCNRTYGSTRRPTAVSLRLSSTERVVVPGGGGGGAEMVIYKYDDLLVLGCFH